MRGDPPRTCLTHPTGTTHDQTHLLSRAASKLRWARRNIPEAGWSLYHHEAFATVGAELQYRIKSEGEAHERVAIEQELHFAESEKSIVAAGS